MSDRFADADRLEEFAAACFRSAGFKEADAALQAETLVWANRRGIDSHGLALLRFYLEFIGKGFMNPNPEIQVITETAATILVEADRSFGPVATVPVMDKCIAKARDVGVAWGLVRNCAHQGAMSYYTSMAVDAGMAGLISCCNLPGAAPPGSRDQGVSTAPIAIAVPGKNRHPLSLDMATSVVARGKVAVAEDRGESIPESWALNDEGRPTTDPSEVVMMQSAGAYKGYGLALMFECLASLMAGSPLLTPTIQQTEVLSRGHQNSWMCVVDISKFTDLEVFRANADALGETMNGLPTVNGNGSILVPGEKETNAFDEREKSGIPLPPGTVGKLRWAAAHCQVPLPPELA
jgi:ureidoglycolate dehydrogenase (NAD+)